MAAMLRTFPRCSRAPGAAVIACIWVTAAAGGCARTVDASGYAAEPTTSAALAELLIDPQRFPAPYLAAELDASAVDAAIRDSDGVPSTALVDPPDCAPPAPGSAPGDAAAVRGVDDTTSSSLTVALTRPAATLAVRREQLADCASFNFTDNGVAYQVAATLLSEPPVDADGGYALDVVVSDGSEVNRRLLTLVAQIDDIRVTATWAGDDGAAADSAALDVAFRDAVLQVRRAGPR